MYTIKIEKFEGPLDLLLQLIEEEELNISEISLAQVADQYIEYIKFQQNNIGAEELSDFLVIAAKLLLIKSKYLLPFFETEQDEDIGDLEKRLKIYKEFLDASKNIYGYFTSNDFSFVKEKYDLENLSLFNPPLGLDVEVMKNAFEEFILKLTPLVILEEDKIRKAVSVQEKLDEIKKLLLGNIQVKFFHLTKSKDKAEVLISFLAILELVKQKIVVVSQEAHFEDIYIDLNEDN